MADSATLLPPGTARHPWSTDFHWSLPDAPPRTLTKEEKEAFDRQGFVVLPPFLDADALATLMAELDELEAETDAFLAGQPKGRLHIAEQGAITFTLFPVLRSQAARALVDHPRLTGVAADLMGPDVNLYWDQSVYKKPEKPRIFPWHQDNGYTFVRPEHYVTCWVSLNGATVDNGCPWVLPQVHRAGTLLHHFVDPIGWQCCEDPPGAVPAEVPPGGVVVFSSLTPHLTGPNRTEAVRKAYIIQYGSQGMRKLTGDWQAGEPPSGDEPCDDPTRQFAVRRGGEPV
jgi:ectoine hydroxylase-related dioxygenase (phytanoyl-CoA dioxygenase family)